MDVTWFLSARSIKSVFLDFQNIFKENSLYAFFKYFQNNDKVHEDKLQ